MIGIGFGAGGGIVPGWPGVQVKSPGFGIDGNSGKFGFDLAIAVRSRKSIRSLALASR